MYLEFFFLEVCGFCWVLELFFFFLNSFRVLVYLFIKDLLKIFIISNLKYEMKIDVFSLCNDENGKLLEILCFLIFYVIF